MLSVFAISFSVLYYVLKWEYVVPQIMHHEQQLSWRLWPIALVGSGFALLQILGHVSRISHEASYVTLAVSLWTVLQPDSNVWLSVCIAVGLSLLFILQTGSARERVATIVLVGVAAAFAFRHRPARDRPVGVRM